MVIYCVAFGCNNEQDYRRISFHGFPFKRPDILKLWIKAVRRENWTPQTYSKLCGEHFLPTDYVVKPGCTAKLLKPNAVPTIFSYTEHLSQKTAEPQTVSHTKDISLQRGPLPEHIEDFEESDLEIKSKRHQYWDVSQQTFQKYRKRINYLRTKLKKQNEKIRAMNSILNDLKKK